MFILMSTYGLYSKKNEAEQDGGYNILPFSYLVSL